jgi:hypothetical protein
MQLARFTYRRPADGAFVFGDDVLWDIYIFTTGLNITRKTFMILLPMGLGLITNIVLNMLLRPEGSDGSCNCLFV